MKNNRPKGKSRSGNLQGIAVLTSGVSANIIGETEKSYRLTLHCQKLGTVDKYIT